MPDNGQMERLIRAAQERVAENAQDASDRDVLLACFGWLAGKLGRCSNRTSWPSYLTVGSLSALVGGGLAAFGKAMGWF